MTVDLTALKKRFQSRAALALTVESDRIIVSLVRAENGGKISPPLSVPITAKGLLENPVKAGTELAAALGTAQFRERRCVVCLPPSWALTASADLPQVNPEDLRGYFELRAEREFSTSDLRLAHSPFSLPGGQQRATLAAIPIKRMEALAKMLETAGCHPVSISLALDGCFSKPDPTLHLLINATHTDAIVSSGGGIAGIRTLTNPDSSNLAAFARELRITLGRLPEAVRQPVKQARIVGPHDPALPEVIERMGFAHSVEVGGELSNPAIECAQRFLREQPVPFEFVVPEISRWPALIERFNTRRGRQIAAGAVALVLLPLFVFVVRSHIESSMDAEWSGMKDTVADMDELQQKVRQFRPWFEPSPQKLQALETLISTFPDKGELWTKSVQIAPFPEKNTGNFKVTLSVFARTSAARETILDRLNKQPGVSAVHVDQIRGNNPVQFSLTYKWEPKHDK